MHENGATTITSLGLSQGGSGTQSELLNFFVDGKILFDIEIGGRNERLRLIIIVVGDEVLYGIFRKELLKFPVQLGGQGLVVTQDERGTVYVSDHIGHP